MTWSVYGTPQPPRVKSPRVSSSGMAGACITPSREMFSVTEILRMTHSYQGAGDEHGHTAAMTTAMRFHRWRSWGGAERRALLLHGSTSSSATWWRSGPALAEAGWRVKAPDLLSHGASPRADRALTPEVAAAALAAELADRPIDLVI